MSNPTPHNSAKSAQQISLKIFGVGTAGIQVLEELATRSMPNATCIAVGACADALVRSSAVEKVCVASGLPPVLPVVVPGGERPLSATGDVPVATSASGGGGGAEGALARLRAACQGAQIVFILAGLGGGTGTEVSPLLARVARESGALALAFVTLPFDCEGNRRRDHARNGLARLKAEADGVICLPNQKMFKRLDEKTSVVDAFKLTNQLLAEGVSGLWRLLARKGLIEIHRTDLCAMLAGRAGECSVATAEASGAGRAREVVDTLLAHPLLEGGKVLSEADAVLVGILGGPDLTMAEVNRVMENINAKCRNGQVMMGAAIDETCCERLALTVIATREEEEDENLVAHAGLDEMAHAAGMRPMENLEDQLLNRMTTRRPHSRFVPPPPSLPPEQVQQLMAKQAGRAPRARKGSPRMRQGQLPLEIVSKGRFDKSEPTIHKGEDLDVPTYIRRGVALN